MTRRIRSRPSGIVSPGRVDRGKIVLAGARGWADASNTRQPFSWLAERFEVDVAWAGDEPGATAGVKWARLDSNQGPTDYESAALTS